MASQNDFLAFVNRAYKPHRNALALFAVPALFLMLVVSQWWLFWPLMIWSLVFLVHFLTYKSLAVSSDWIDERTARTAEKAYDIAIIEALQDRYEPSIAASEATVNSESAERKSARPADDGERKGPP